MVIRLPPLLLKHIRTARASCSGSRHFPLQTRPQLASSNLFQSLLSTWTIQVWLYSSAFIHVTMAVLSREERKSMADLPTSHTQLTWLEREEPTSLRLPLAATNTTSLQKKTCTEGRSWDPLDQRAFPRGLDALGHILSGTMWKMRPRQFSGWLKPS